MSGRLKEGLQQLEHLHAGQTIKSYEILEAIYVAGVLSFSDSRNTRVPPEIKQKNGNVSTTLYSFVPLAHPRYYLAQKTCQADLHATPTC